VVTELRRVAAAVLGPRPPEPGERAIGHNVVGAVVAVPKQQPLSADNVWRVVLAGEPFGRLVGRGRGGAWQLLQLDDLTDAQLDAHEEAMSINLAATDIADRHLMLL
jgi:hypothetical protein